MDKYASAEGGLMDVMKANKRDPKKAHLHEMTVRKGHKGGFIAKHTEHRHNDGQIEHEHPDRNAEFPLATQDQLMEHMQEHMGEESREIAQGGGEEEPEGTEQQQ